MVSGEWASTGICAVLTRRKTDHKQSGGRIAKWWYGTAMVIWILDRNFIHKVRESLAGTTISVESGAGV